MQYRVRLEQIYDAALDDGAFAQLPALLSKALGARSAVLHWGVGSDRCGELADTGYFSKEHMAQYDRHFAGCDIWGEAINLPSVANRAWNCEQLVSGSVFEKSRIYNEWIRAIGDDTFYAVGAVIRADWGSGEIGFHRGRSQGAFNDEAVKALSQDLDHLRRMLSIRAKLGTLEAKERLTQSSLDALGDGVLSLSTSGRVLNANIAAEAILKRADGLYLSKGKLRARTSGDQLALEAALLRAAGAAAEGSGLLIHRQNGGCYTVSMVSASTDFTNRQIVMVVNEMGVRESHVESRLREMFSLSPSEARLARRLAEGATVDEVATERGTAIGTIRSQLKSVGAKLGCGRQAEIVGIVKDLPRLLAQNSALKPDSQGLGSA